MVLLIDLFATYEFLLYAALVMRRLQAPVARTRTVLVAGVWLYGVTRLIQVGCHCRMHISESWSAGDGTQWLHGV